MWAVSQQFLDAVKTSHGLAIKIETYRDGQWVETPITGGSVRMDYYGLVTRSLDAEMAPEFSSVLSRTRLDSFSPTIYGAYIRVYRGVKFANGNTEYAPAGVFVIDRYSRETGSGYGLSVSGSDLYSMVNRARLELPRTVSGSSRIQVVQDLITEALEPNLPWGSVVFRVSTDAQAADTNLRQTGIDRDRGAAIRDILAGAGMRGYFAADGAFEISMMASESTTPVSTITTGDDGTLMTVKEAVSRDQIYNIVVTLGEPLNTDDPPVTAVARDTDVNSPTYWLGPFGKVPYFYSSQFIYTTQQAQAVADAMLLKVRGAASAFDVDIVPNPALEPGDVLNMIYGSDQKVDTHLITQISLPLKAGSGMSLTTSLLSTEGVTVPLVAPVMRGLMG